MRPRPKANPAAEAARLPHTLRPCCPLPARGHLWVGATHGQRWAQPSSPAIGSSPRASPLTTGKFFQVQSLSSSICLRFMLQPSTDQGLRITEDAAASACPTTMVHAQGSYDPASLPPPTEQRSPVPAEARQTPESNTVVIFCWALQPHRPARNETLPGPDPNSKHSMMLRAQTTRTSPRGLGYSFQTLLSLATEKREKKTKNPSTPSTFNPGLQGLHTTFSAAPRPAGSGWSRPPGHGKPKAAVGRAAGWEQCPRHWGACTHNLIPLRTLLTSARGEHDRPADIILVVHVAFD